MVTDACLYEGGTVWTMKHCLQIDFFFDQHAVDSRSISVVHIDLMHLIHHRVYGRDKIRP
jgi:hypothetical protein